MTDSDSEDVRFPLSSPSQPTHSTSNNPPPQAPLPQTHPEISTGAIDSITSLTPRDKPLDISPSEPRESSPLLPASVRDAPFQPSIVDQPQPDNPHLKPRYGMKAFLDDCSDMQNGSVPVSFLIAVVIGIVCGFAAFLYYEMLEFFLRFFWETAPEFLSEHLFWPTCLHWVWIPIVCAPLAVLVGVGIKLIGFPGDLAYTIKCVHKDGYIALDHVLPMLVVSQVSIVGGASLGPEAPLVAICASIGGWISTAVFKQRYKNLVRKHTLCGMACALAAFFGVPLGGSLFALEVNSRLGYEYYEHALEAIASGTICLVVFRTLAQLPIEPIYKFTAVKLEASSTQFVLTGALLGLIGAGIASLFAHGHKAIVKRLKKLGWHDDPVKLSIFGGVGIIILGILIPHTLFWGEYEMQTIGSLSPAAKLPHIWPTTGLTGFEITGFGSAVLAGFAKLLAISFSVAGGYRGGFIFPFFAAGASFGRAIWYLFPGMSPVVAILSMAAGINVTITRTTLATTLILAGLAGEINAISAVLAASLSAAFASYYMVSWVILCSFLFFLRRFGF